VLNFCLATFFQWHDKFVFFEGCAMRTYLFFVHLLVVLLSVFLFGCGGGGSACEKLIEKTISCRHLSLSSDQRSQAIQSCEDEYNKLSSDQKNEFDRRVDQLTCSDIADCAHWYGIGITYQI
jgi:hypothetical protein